jgi:hypothetical protein
VQEEQFTHILSNPARSLYSDPLRKDARRRQAFLLISSVVTILLFTGTVSLSEANPSNVKMVIQHAGNVLWVSWAITCYALISFGVVCYQDVLIDQALNLPDRSQVAKALREVTATLIERWKEDRQTLNEANEIFAKQLERAKRAEAFSAGDPVAEDTLNKRAAQLWEEVKRIRADKSAFDQPTTLEKKVRQSMRLRRARTIVDIVFPPCLGLYAILYPFLRH